MLAVTYAVTLTFDPLTLNHVILNNSAADRPILFKFGTYIDHMTRHLPYMFKVKGAKVKVTTCPEVLASKNRYIS